MVQFDTDFEYDEWFEGKQQERVREDCFGMKKREVLRDGESEIIR